MSAFRRRFVLGAASALAAYAPLWTLAQSYPTRPVRAIVPFAPGGATDVIARLIGQMLSERVGQPFYVDNIPGAGGNIGTMQGARAPADGYTVLFAFSSFVTSPSLFDKLPFDPYKDFSAVTLAVATPAILFVNPSMQVKELAELVTLIKANPRKYSFASGGIGTQPHLAAEQLRLSLGLDVVHVPFNGGGPAVASVVAGHAPFGFTTLAPAMPQINSGKLRALAVTGRRRWRALPDVQTMAEAGYPAIEGDSWVGVLVPAGTPLEIISVLNRAIVSIVKLPELTERLAALGFEPIGSTADEYAAQIKSEIAKWAKVIQAAGVKAQ